LVGHGNGNGFQVFDDEGDIQLDYSRPGELQWRRNVQLVYLFTCHGANFMSSTEGFCGFVFDALQVGRARDHMLTLFNRAPL
jgi:hypothetical protein